MTDIITKLCTGQCKENKPLDYFCLDKNKKYGRSDICKECKSIYDKAYRAANKEKIKENKKRYEKANREKITKQKKEYAQKNKEHIDQYQKEYRKKNKARIAAAQREWRNRNKEHIAQQKVKWREDNRDRHNEARYRREALKKGLTVEKVDYTAIRERDHTCYLCLDSFTDQERYDTSLTHVDHKIPLSRGGKHSYENCALTHAKCNLQKCDKTPDEYWESKESL